MPIEIIWRPFGDGIVRVVKGVIVFPREPRDTKHPKVPGAYRLSFNNNGYIYIGKAGDLRSRFSNYRRPTQGTEGEYIVHYALLEAGGATVDVVTDGDLSCGSVRSMLEKAAIQGATGRLLNRKKGLAVDPYYLRLKIRYHSEMLAEATKTLADLGNGGSFAG
jgi:hypothetical protein